MRNRPVARTADPGSQMSAKHIKCEITQASKDNQNVCGDYFLISRTAEYTIFILCDGIGSGIKANIAAIMCANRLLKLIQSGLSLIKACEKVVAMMHKAHTTNVPFAAFSILYILNNGQYTVISYESPPPLLIDEHTAEPLQQRFFSLGYEIVGETTGTLQPGQSIVLISDGVTQAGLGLLKGLGWGIDGLTKYLNRVLKRIDHPQDLITGTLQQAWELSDCRRLDDTSMAVLTCCEATVLNILTGPPAYKKDDEEAVRTFNSNGGYKIICGSSTAEIAARVMNRPIEVIKISPSFSQPPQYSIAGIDVVSEGAVTLNQVYNILEENQENYDPESCVSIIAELMKKADIINFYIGGAKNPSHQQITFKQLGVLPRKTIVKLIIDKLKKMGKTVTEHNL